MISHLTVVSENPLRTVGNANELALAAVIVDALSLAKAL